MDIEALAKQAGFDTSSPIGMTCLEIFADLVASEEREACAKKNELLIRLVTAVSSSEFGGVSCFDIEGHGNWFDVRDTLLRSNAQVSGPAPLLAQVRSTDVL